MEIRDSYLAHFRDTAREIFANRPELRSIVLAVSQYVHCSPGTSVIAGSSP